ncbi:hypothetical protein ACKWTF_000058 [Chironomus riparius]
MKVKEKLNSLKSSLCTFKNVEKIVEFEVETLIEQAEVEKNDKLDATEFKPEKEINPDENKLWEIEKPKCEGTMLEEPLKCELKSKIQESDTMQKLRTEIANVTAIIKNVRRPTPELQSVESELTIFTEKLPKLENKFEEIDRNIKIIVEAENSIKTKKTSDILAVKESFSKFKNLLTEIRDSIKPNIDKEKLTKEEKTENIEQSQRLKPKEENGDEKVEVNKKDEAVEVASLVDETEEINQLKSKEKLKHDETQKSKDVEKSVGLPKIEEKSKLLESAVVQKLRTEIENVSNTIKKVKRPTSELQSTDSELRIIINKLSDIENDVVEINKIIKIIIKTEDSIITKRTSDILEVKESLLCLKNVLQELSDSKKSHIEKPKEEQPKNEEKDGVFKQIEEIINEEKPEMKLEQEISIQSQKTTENPIEIETPKVFETKKSEQEPKLQEIEIDVKEKIVKIRLDEASLKIKSEIENVIHSIKKSRRPTTEIQTLEKILNADLELKVLVELSKNLTKIEETLKSIEVTESSLATKKTSDMILVKNNINLLKEVLISCKTKLSSSQEIKEPEKTSIECLKQEIKREPQKPELPELPELPKEFEQPSEVLLDIHEKDLMSQYIVGIKQDIDEVLVLIKKARRPSAELQTLHEALLDLKPRVDNLSKDSTYFDTVLHIVTKAKTALLTKRTMEMILLREKVTSLESSLILLKSTVITEINGEIIAAKQIEETVTEKTKEKEIIFKQNEIVSNNQNAILPEQEEKLNNVLEKSEQEQVKKFDEFLCDPVKLEDTEPQKPARRQKHSETSKIDEIVETKTEKIEKVESKTQKRLESEISPAPTDRLRQRQSHEILTEIQSEVEPVKPLRRKRADELKEEEKSLPRTPETRRKRMPIFIARLKNRSAPENSILKLTCAVSEPEVTARWTKNRMILKDTEKYLIENSNGVLSLEIKNACFQDAGEYYCFVSNSCGEIETSAFVTIFGEDVQPSNTTFTKNLRDSYDQVTNKLIIECNIKTSLDFSNHKIKWYKDDIEMRPSYMTSSGGIPTTYEQEIDENTGRVKLIITYPMNTDCGLYRCCVHDKNSHKVDEISHLVYKIFNPPPHIPLEELEIGEKRNRIVFDNHLNDIYADDTNKSIRLNCKISQCNAQSEIKWYKNNEELPIEDYREKYRFTKSYNRLCLEILHPKLNDAGVYECSVKNQYNETSTKCHVYVNEKAERQRSKTTPRESSFIDFSTGTIIDKEQSVNYQDEIEDSNKILLERSTREIAARIHRSTDLIDIPPSSVTFTATERPNFATPLSDRMVTENSSSVKFTCSLLSPECDISWEKNGIPIRPSSKFTQTFTDGLAILEIFDVSDDDAGKYACTASNKFGDNSTSARLKVYSGFKPSVCMPPTVMRQMKESYNLYNDLLTLECRVRGTPKPHIQWMKDGDYIMPGDKYQQTELPDGTCKLIIQSPDPEEDSGTYTCEAECNGCSDSISHNVQYEGSVENQFNRVHRYYHRDPLKPYFKTGLVDTNVPSGGSIALFVESQANCEAEWYRDRWIVDHKPPKRYIFNDGSGFFACVINHATMDEAAKYSCKLSNPYGTSQSTSFIDVINPNQVGKGQKPPIFLTRPQPEIKIRAGDPFSMSFRVQGEPKPRIQWYKGARDITNAGRTIKEVFNDYVRFSIKESKENDSGIYFITARNRHGVDRSFCQVTVRERQELSSSDAAKLSNIDFTDVSYMKNPPGQIPNEPTVIDSSANHLSLSWMKPQCNDAAPVVGYRIDVWLVGKEGDATWKEIGTSGLASFDVFNLKHGCEYHFRVTPRNRYGYGPSTQTTYPVMFGDVVKLPEFTKILPGQLKALINDDITLECVSMGSPRPDIVWYKDGIRIDSNEKHVISVMGPLCRLIIHNVTENDNGRYTCEASNKEGRVSTFARVQTVTDPKLLEADNKLKKNIETDLEQLSVGDEILPQFTMRLRDRRVQCTYPVRLTCQALAVPHATIEWFKEGIKLIEDDRIAFLQENQFSTLEFSRTYLEDSGQYTVTARNELGSVSCHCNLTVDKGIRAYISPEFIKPLDIVCTYNEGQDIHLEAHVEAYPSVGVTWHHNGIRLRPSRKIQASLDCDGIVSLIITETTVKDAGTYTCVASNAVGRVESTCRINIIENSDKKSRVIPSIVAPDAPYSKEPLFLIRPRSSEAFEGDTVIIMCEVIGDPKPEVLWLRDFLKPEYYKDAQHFRSVIGNESEYRLEIPHAKIEYTGTYSVIASNCYGQAKAIISLQIYAKDLGRSMDAGSIIHGNIETLPRIVKHLKDLRCCDGDAITLECHVEGTPEPNVFWEKDGKILHDRSTEHRQNFNGHKATLSIQRVFPEDEGQYCLVACNNMGRVKSFACIIVDVPEEKENLLSRQLSRPMTFLSPNSTPRSTPRSTPARSMSPFSLHLSMITNNAHLSYRQRRYRFSAPKFYSVPHNRVCEEGDTVRFQCAIAGHPIPWSTWDKDGVIVTPSQRHIIKERDDMRYLEIEEVCFEDAGLYRITLENEYGRIEATARLDIIKSNKVNRRGIRASSAPNRDSRSISRRIMGYSTKIGGRMALAGQRASSIPAKKTVYHDGYDITDCERLTITENENEILIEIDTVKTYDEGEYTLMLEDEDGIITTTTTFAKVHYVDDEIFREKIPPKIKHHLINNVTSIEGIPLDLTLHLDCKIPFDYVWFKNNEPIINSDDFIYIDHGNGILTLRIQDPFVFDSGKYSCVITTLSGECTSECDVEIEELYEINVLDVIPEFIKAPLPFISLPGCLASFCARITPVDSEVIWSVCGCEINDDMKDYKIERLEDGLNVLHVLNVDHRQSGEIKCRVISCNNPKIFNVYHTSLTVLPVPISERYEPIESVLENNCNNNNKSNKSSEAHDLDLSCFITKRPEDRTVLVGDSIELNVSYIGYPDPKVHWMRAERLIENQPNTIIITKNGHSRLIINNITSDQSGKYSVEIMNEHSTDIASASVAVEGVPDAPVSLSFSKGSDRIAVAWSGPPYDGGCMLTGFLLEMQHDNGEWKEVAKIVDSLAYTVKNLVHDVKYRFRVRAQNIHGSSAPSKSTEEIILVKPIDMDSEEGDETYSSVPQIKTGGDFKTRFDILEELGKGRFGTVYRVMERETRLILAAKIIKCIKAMDRKKVQDEIKIMKSLQHHKLLQLSASFETQKEIIMVME